MNPFGNNYKNTGLPKPKSKQDFRNGILCAVITEFCIFIRSLLFAVILGFCTVCYFAMYFKHKAVEEKIEAEIGEYDEEDEYNAVPKKISRQEKKQRKAEYEEYLQSIEDEFKIIDDDEEDEYDDEDEI